MFIGPQSGTYLTDELIQAEPQSGTYLTGELVQPEPQSGTYLTGELVQHEPTSGTYLTDELIQCLCNNTLQWLFLLEFQLFLRLFLLQ